MTYVLCAARQESTNEAHELDPIKPVGITQATIALSLHPHYIKSTSTF